MAHEKVYGIREDKCRVEVYPKAQTYSKTETDTKITNVNTAISTVNSEVDEVDASLNQLKNRLKDASTGAKYENDQVGEHITAMVSATSLDDVKAHAAEAISLLRNAVRDICDGLSNL